MATMRTAICEVLERNHVTFAELSRLVEGFNGELAICAAGKPNVILWHGVSDAAAAELDALHREGVFEYRPAGTFVYFIDGAVLKLPLVKSRRAYKTPHWLPVTLCTKDIKSLADLKASINKRAEA